MSNDRVMFFSWDIQKPSCHLWNCTLYFDACSLHEFVENCLRELRIGLGVYGGVEGPDRKFLFVLQESYLSEKSKYSSKQINYSTKQNIYLIPPNNFFTPFHATVDLFETCTFILHNWLVSFRFFSA